MLKKRIVAALPMIDGVVVQSIGFKRYLPVGRLEIAVEFLNRWGIDEIAILDLSATKAGRSPDYNLVRRAARFAQVPIAYGGGVSSVQDIRTLLSHGADKVIMNQGIYRDEQLVSMAANTFGNQCLIGSMDILKVLNTYYRYDYFVGKVVEENWQQRLRSLTEKGIGEWLINAVHCDGMYGGYDLALIDEIANQVDVPVIPLGGYGRVEHLAELFKNAKVEVAAIGNKLHFMEHSVNVIKSRLRNRGDIRMDSDFNYVNHSMDDNDRLYKLSDQQLEELLFERIEEEVI